MSHEEVIASQDIASQMQQVQALGFNSFRLSKGDNNLQHRILDFAGFRFGDQFSEEALDLALEPTHQAAFNARINPLTHAQPEGGTDTDNHQIMAQIEAQSRGDVSDAIEGLRLSKNAKRPRYHIDSLIGHLLVVDNKFIPPRGGSIPYTRRGPKLVIEHDYISNMVHHGILGRSTGVAEYDAMFVAVRQRIPRLMARPSADMHRYTRIMDAMVAFEEVAEAHVAAQPADLGALQAFLYYEVMEGHTRPSAIK